MNGDQIRVLFVSHHWLETCAASAARKTLSNRNIARSAVATTVRRKDRFAEANLIQALSRIKRASRYVSFIDTWHQ